MTVCFQETIHLQFEGHKLDKKDFFGKSDPYLVFSRSNEDGRYQTLHCIALPYRKSAHPFMFVCFFFRPRNMRSGPVWFSHPGIRSCARLRARPASCAPLASYWVGRHLLFRSVPPTSHDPVSFFRSISSAAGIEQERTLRSRLCETCSCWYSVVDVIACSVLQEPCQDNALFLCAHSLVSQSVSFCLRALPN